MTEPTPLDRRLGAFAEALGHAVAESVWREIRGAESQKTDAPEWKSEAPKENNYDETNRNYKLNNAFATTP